MLAILRSRFAETRPAERNGIAAHPTRAPAASRRHRRFDRNPPPLILIPVWMSRWRTASPGSQKAALRGIMA